MPRNQYSPSHVTAPAMFQPRLPEYCPCQPILLTLATHTIDPGHPYYCPCLPASNYFLAVYSTLFFYGSILANLGSICIIQILTNCQRVKVIASGIPHTNYHDPHLKSSNVRPFSRNVLTLTMMMTMMTTTTTTTTTVDGRGIS